VRQLEVVGSTRASQVIDIKPKADGTIVEIVYEAGKRLEQGDVLFRLDDAIQKADLAEAQASLAKAQQALKRGRTLKQSRVMATATLEDLEAPALLRRPRWIEPPSALPTGPSARHLPARPRSAGWTWARRSGPTPC
jgi:multidrug efflux pump subunit AcrA (membrane-fusion protein)